MRTLVDIPEDQMAALTALSRKENTSRAAVIREAVAKLLAERQADETRQAFDAAFGIWANRGIDGVEYQRAMRAEWPD